jgi:hypothetical protein
MLITDVSGIQEIRKTIDLSADMRICMDDYHLNNVYIYLLDYGV